MAKTASKKKAPKKAAKKEEQLVEAPKAEEPAAPVEPVAEPVVEPVVPEEPAAAEPEVPVAAEPAAEPAQEEPQGIRILFAASEATPFAKTGGLGDVGGSLPYALAEAGARVSVILPKYATIPAQYVEQMEHVTDFYMPLSWRNVYCGIEKLTMRGVDFYFVDNEDYFKRDACYGYFDDGERFAFFAKAIVEAMEYVEGLQCDVLHCNDWQTALAPVFLREFYRGDGRFDNVKTVFTVHNVKFQGQYSDFILGDILGLAGIPAAANQLRCDERSINYMLGALRYSDALTTVSPSYANELKMPYYGEHLDYVFRERESILSGVLNGIDLLEWDPATDPSIAANFSVDDMAGKAVCKKALQEELGLDVDPNAPLVGMVGRLTAQKGMDLVQYALEELIQGGFEVVVLGTGDAEYEESMRWFDQAHGNRMRACITFDNNLAHRIYAGADLFLSQMISMRYGTLPVVRETGGLRDSVIPYNQFTGEGTGFSFANFNADEMAGAMWIAGELYESNRPAWDALRKQAMEEDFSWTRAAGQYLDIYYGLHPELR